MSGTGMGDAPVFDERMSDYDRIMWVIEQNPHLRSTITAITLLDTTPTIQQVTRRVDRASRRVARLRQRVVSNPYSIAPPRWEVDPDFDLAFHLRFASLDGEGTLDDVVALTEPLAMQSFDRKRPLWEFLFVDGLAGGASALITKLHHSITDGTAAIALMLELLTVSPEDHDSSDLPPLPQGRVLNPVERLRNGIGHELGRQRTLLRQGIGALDYIREDPREALRDAREMTSSAARLSAGARRAHSPLMTGRSLSAEVHLRHVPLAELKAAAQSAGSRLNDAFIVAVLNGFRRYHQALEMPTRLLRVGIPINARADSGSTAGNRFLPARIDVPVDVDDPAEHMRIVRDLVRAQRDDPVWSLLEPLAGFASRLPRFVLTGALTVALRAQDVNISNVPGVDFPVYFAGARVAAQYPIGPLAGAAANVTLLSYLDQAYIGVNLDPAAVTDGPLLMRCLDEGIRHVIGPAKQRATRARAPKRPARKK